MTEEKEFDNADAFSSEIEHKAERLHSVYPDGEFIIFAAHRNKNKELAVVSTSETKSADILISIARSIEAGRPAGLYVLTVVGALFQKHGMSAGLKDLDKLIKRIGKKTMKLLDQLTRTGIILGAELKRCGEVVDMHGMFLSGAIYLAQVLAKIPPRQRGAAIHELLDDIAKHKEGQQARRNGDAETVSLEIGVPLDDEEFQLIHDNTPEIYSSKNGGYDEQWEEMKRKAGLK